MGKGGGCKPSKISPPWHISHQDAPRSLSRRSITLEEHTINSSSQIDEGDEHTIKKLRIFIVFYSMYGHVEGLARWIKKGVDGIDGVEGVLYRVPETLPPDVLKQMRVPSKGDEIPVISVEELVEADGFLFGFPTRFGSMASQMKAFFDLTGEFWAHQKLAGVPAGFFVSTGTQGGGQETTA